MDDTRDSLGRQLEAHYRSYGWPVSRLDDGLVEAAGPGGVSWHAMAIVGADLEAPERLDARLLELGTRRMPGGGELCPLELIPATGCEAGLRDALDRTGLSTRPHVSVYALSVAAA